MSAEEAAAAGGAAPGGVERFAGRTRKETTFKGKLDQPVQRWFSITPSYAPALVSDCAEHLGDGPAERYLDPFSGSGTTAVWCRLADRACTAVEWNPALYVVSRVKAGWMAEADGFARAAEAFLAAWRAALGPLAADGASGGAADADEAAGRYLLRHEQHVPRISHPERWWARPTLAALTAARAALAAEPPPDALRPGIELALLGILVEVSRARYSHASITFSHREPVAAPDALAAFARRAAEIAADLRLIAGQSQRLGSVVRGNSLRLDEVVPAAEAGSYTRVICSPPYPNRYSYARETRPHLFFLDLVPDAAAVGELEWQAMGGTWGRATSALLRPHEPETPEVAGLMAPLLPALRAAHPLMANYAVRYFNDLWLHVRALDRAMARHARMAYVIGNCKLGGVEVPVAEWLLRLFELTGWRAMGQGIHHMRRRNSRAGLVESAVFVER